MGEDRQGRQDAHTGVTGNSRAAYEADVRNAIRYERILAARALIPCALVAVVIEIYLYFH